MLRSLKAWLALTVLALLSLTVSATVQRREPFHGSGTITPTSINTGGCFDSQEFTTAGRTVPLGIYSGSGHEFVFYCADPNMEGVITFIADNGDRVFTHYVATRIDWSRFSGILTITGGTGRFLDAGGTARFTVTDYSPGDPFDMTFDGFIVYPQNTQRN